MLDAQRRVLRAAACARRFAPRLGRSTACRPRLARERLRARLTRWHATACERSARTPFARLSCTPSGRTGTVCACKLSGLLAGAATWQQRLPTCSSVLVGEPSSAGGRSPITFAVHLVERVALSPRPRRRVPRALRCAHDVLCAHRARTTTGPLARSRCGLSGTWSSRPGAQCGGTRDACNAPSAS